VVPNLWRLADSDYDNSHRYYVNATPNVGDVYNPATGQWRTILVGGLGAGGRGYYALDITDPLAPDVLWEYTADDNANLGLTYGNPVITKNKAGLWTVVITSGYNNTGPGDGKGYLIQLNANTGAVVQTISTTSGDGTTPSNLGRLNAWVPQDTDNTAELFYAGDMLGNLWRFDSDDVVAPTGAGALLLGQATTPSGGAQPITARPLLSELTLPTGEKVPLVTFGTGRYLGETDMPDSTMQSVYVIKDARRTTGLGELRSTPANLVQRTLGTDRKFTSTPDITWSEKNGWFFDLDQSTRERVYLDATPLVPGIISVASVIPDGDPCTAGGTSWIYDLKLVGGSVLQATQYKVPIVGLGRVITKSGARGLVTTQEGLADPPPTQPLVADPPASVRRTSWRELSD
jgi:type IV pilus assembly protein PilY1